MTPTLITIPFSHYCEKARWALDHARVDYREQAYLPGLHRRATRRVGGGSVPVLVTDSATLRQSTDIVRYADERAPDGRRLYPREHRDAIEALVTRFDRELGPATRLLAYHFLLPQPAVLVRAVGAKMSTFDKLRMRALLPLFQPLMRKQMRINDESATRARETVRKVFADVGARLSNGFLVGGRFTAADLTFASLATPVVVPRGHAHMVHDVEVSGTMRAIIDEARASAAGAHVQAMYDSERAKKP